MNTHLHITSWVLAFILFAVVLILNKLGKEKGAKIVQMILRLDYLFILITGAQLFIGYVGEPHIAEAVIKAIAGIWAIYSMEMISLKSGREEPTRAFWIQLIIAVILTLILGFGRLPYGILP